MSCDKTKSSPCAGPVGEPGAVGPHGIPSPAQSVLGPVAGGPQAINWQQDLSWLVERFGPQIAEILLGFLTPSTRVLFRPRSITPA